MRSAQVRGEVEAALARHHQVEDDQVEGEAAELAARIGRILGGGDEKAVVGQIAGEQPAQPGVVVDHEDMRRFLMAQLGRCRASITRRACADCESVPDQRATHAGNRPRSSGSIIARSTVRNPCGRGIAGRT